MNRPTVCRAMPLNVYRFWCYSPRHTRQDPTPHGASMKPATLSAVVVVFAMPVVALVAQQGDATADHRDMLARLHITTPLRPGPAGRLNADGTAPPNYANYDETKATAKSPVPPLLV